MSKQIPPGPKDLDCPLWRKSMAKVCHRCPWYVEMQSQSAEGVVNVQWVCAVPAQLGIASETKRQIIQHAAATESMRNEIVKRMDNTRVIAPALPNGSHVKKISHD